MALAVDEEAREGAAGRPTSTSSGAPSRHDRVAAVRRPAPRPGRRGRRPWRRRSSPLPRRPPWASRSPAARHGAAAPARPARPRAPGARRRRGSRPPRPRRRPARPGRPSAEASTVSTKDVSIVAGDEGGMGEDALEEGERRPDADHPVLGRRRGACARMASSRLSAQTTSFESERVVVDRHLPALVRRPSRRARRGRRGRAAPDAARARQEAGVGVLGVDAALDRVPALAEILLPERQRLALRRSGSAASRGRRPVTISVTGCSTWSRVFISRKYGLAVRVHQELDRPRVRRSRRRRASATASSPIRSPQLGGEERETGSPRSPSGGAAGSSTRARRGGRRSRGGRRGPGSRRGAAARSPSRGRRASSPKALPRLRARAGEGASAAPPARRTSRRPLPPPPAAALSMTG